MVSILLASASERRREILSEIVNESTKLESRALASDEINPSSGIEVSQRVELICSAKAQAAAQEVTISGEQPDLVVVSDTLVEDPTDPLIALGQPIDELMAASMLLGLREEDIVFGPVLQYFTPLHLTEMVPKYYTAGGQPTFGLNLLWLSLMN